MSKYMLYKYFLKLRLSEVLLYVECPSKIHMLKSNSQCGGIWRWVPRPWEWNPPEWNQCPYIYKKSPQKLTKEQPSPLSEKLSSSTKRIGMHMEFWGRMGTESSLTLQLCKDSARRQPSMKQEAGLTWHQICWHLDLGLPSLWNCEK